MAEHRNFEPLSAPTEGEIASLNCGGEDTNAILHMTGRTSSVQHRGPGAAVRLGSVEMPAPVNSEEAAHERALQEVGETMLMIEAAITRVDKALSAVRLEAEPDRQALVGLTKAKRDLEGVRRRLHQDVYLYVDALPFE